MDIHLLVISVGNTRTAVGAFVAGELCEVRRVTNGDATALEHAVSAAWDAVKTHESVAVAGASVNPQAERHAAEIALRLTGQSPRWVLPGNTPDPGRGLPLPIKVTTEHPEQTGVDRVLNVAAAYEQLGKACCVVDAGTAVTLSFCNDKGEFLGGAIAPGVRLQLQSLAKGTARLPQTDLVVPSGTFGRSTLDAIHHGVYHGIRGLVKEVLENFASHLGTWPELIATGGDAELLFANWELTHAVAPDLQLYGIALAYAESLDAQD